ncbi:PAS domain-containing protein [Streptomyces dysideae]|uniref:PAS domain-containing protein n=1 Tax=Streptomyces dysideae TaxID=909626 RepID=UPI00099EEC90|nr:PAS domain-containing protein [Streptomyces dysideae]
MWEAGPVVGDAAPCRVAAVTRSGHRYGQRARRDPRSRGRSARRLVVVIDARGVVMVWSSGARRLLGYAPEEVVGRPPACLPRGFPPRCGVT